MILDENVLPNLLYYYEDALLIANSRVSMVMHVLTT